MGVPKSLLEHRLVYLPEFPVVLPVQENDVVSLFAAADPTRVHEKMDDPVPAGVAEHRAERTKDQGTALMNSSGTAMPVRNGISWMIRLRPRIVLSQERQMGMMAV